MTLFNIVYVRRSDGKQVVSGKHKSLEKNEPTKEQLDAKPNAKGVSDYYRVLGKNDAKHVDWRRKLGAMLVKELGGRIGYASDKAYILHDLPGEYRLYEHIKSKASDDGKSSKTHAGGGHDRQDAYLYGHPGGRKKRYRSPADFFPHLLWLCADEAGDALNCACKICAPDELQPDTKSPAIGSTNGVKKEPRQSYQITGRNPSVEIPARATNQLPTNPMFIRPNAASASSTPTNASARPNAPSTPNVKSPDHQMDMEYGRLGFRTGEVVWFSRGPTWGLGIILRRWQLPNIAPQHHKRYLVQPLSAPYLPQSPTVIESESLLRPWLAWSPPKFCSEGLNGLPNLSFNNADWVAISAGRYGGNGNPSITVDASILAARAIDATYTPIGMITATPLIQLPPNSQPHFSTHQVSWTGIYLGGERLWIGDPVRLRMTSNEDVLVISEIFERPQPDPHSSATKIYLIGNLFSCTVITPDPNNPDTSALVPTRMREDLEARNRALMSIGLPRNYWKLAKARQTVDLADVKGRWYETSTMIPLIDNLPNYDECIRNGRTDSIVKILNNRVEMGRNLGSRFENREGAVGLAIPNGTRFVDGLEVPLSHELPPPGPQQGGEEGAMQGDAEMGGVQQDPVDQFMDLGDMDSVNLPHFGHEYEGQGSFFS